MTTTTPQPTLDVDKALRIAAGTGRLALRLLSNVETLVVDIARDALAAYQDADALYLASVDAAVGLRATARATPRLLRILKEATHIAADYRLHQTRARIVGADRAAPALLAVHERSAARVKALCIELRGPILKLAQLASSRPDLLPAPWIEALSTLQDRVPPVPFDAIAAALEAALGAPLSDRFATLDEVPLATASLAQVHAGTLPDGREVAVKVRLPGVAELFEVDLAALAALESVLDGALPGDVKTTIAELCRSMREELDFEREADSAERFAATTRTHPGVRVPAIVRSHSGPSILTMERIDGVRFPDFLEQASPSGRATVLTALVASACRQVFSDGLIHGDLHPGNVLVELDRTDADGPTVVLLDFGSTLTLAPDRRSALARLVLAILQDDVDTMTREFDAVGFRTRSGAPDTLITVGRSMMAPFRSGANTVPVDPAAMIAEAMAALQADDVVVVPRELVLLGRLVGALAGLVLRYAPGLDLGPVLLGPVAEALAAANEVA